MIKNQRALKILFISNGIFVFASTLLGPLYAILAEQFDADILSISFAWFLYMLSTTLFSFVVSKLGDKVKEQEYLLVIGYAIRIISWILYIFTNNLYMFFAIQMLLGIGQAIGSPAFDAIFAIKLDKGFEINRYAKWQIIQNLSIAIASLIGGLIVNYLGFNILFMAMASLGIISIIIILIQPRKLL
jgi:MFS family permease